MKTYSTSCTYNWGLKISSQFTTQNNKGFVWKLTPQVAPSALVGHVHEKPSWELSTMQVPPFWHGLLEQADNYKGIKKEKHFHILWEFGNKETRLSERN